MSEEIRKKIDTLTAPTTQFTPVSQVQPKKQNNNKLVALFIVAVLALGTLTIFDVQLEDLDPRDWFQEAIPEPPIEPASVELYRFSDLNNNVSLNIEIWLINIGETLAKDIEVYVRSRDQSGFIIFNDYVDITALLLYENDTCSGFFEVPLTNETVTVYHTLEIRWDDGRTSYSKTSLI